MNESKQKTDIAVEVVATWLNQKGFCEAATHLLQESEEVAIEIDNAKYVAWLDYRDEVKQAIRSSGVEDDLPW